MARARGDDAERHVELVPTERRGGYLLRVGGHAQSHVDLDDPTYLAFDYVQRLADVLDACGPAGEPLRVLHVGGAAMTLPRYVAATRPRSSQVVLEPDADLTALVRAELPLPARSGIKVRPVDGRSGLGALPEGRLDAVVVDAFDQGRVPADLVTRECFAELARVLAEPGVLAMNLADRAPFAWSRRAIAACLEVMPQVLVTLEPATQQGRRPGNLVLVASRGEVPLRRLRERSATAGTPYRVLDGRQVSDALGGGRPFTDGDSEPSAFVPSG